MTVGELDWNKVREGIRRLKGQERFALDPADAAIIGQTAAAAEAFLASQGKIEPQAKFVIHYRRHPDGPAEVREWLSLRDVVSDVEHFLGLGYMRVEIEAPK